MKNLKSWKERAPDIVSFIFFIGIWVSLSFWLKQWLTPPTQVAQPFPIAEQTIPPLSSAANLFGGSEQASTLANVQLNGVIRSNRAQESVVIIATETGPPRALRLHSEVMPGIVVKEINSRSVILSGKGTEREIALPAFASQSGVLAETAGLAGQQNATMPRQQPSATRALGSSPPSAPVAIVGGGAGVSNSGTMASGGGDAAQGATAAGQSVAPTPLQEPRIVLPSENHRR